MIKDGFFYFPEYHNRPRRCSSCGRVILRPAFTPTMPARLFRFILREGAGRVAAFRRRNWSDKSGFYGRHIWAVRRWNDAMVMELSAKLQLDALMPLDQITFYMGIGL